MSNLVCIVDDNLDFRESTAWWLEGEGYDVESYATPSQALFEIGSKKNDKNVCILMDVRMPEMSGLDLHDHFKEQGVRIPIIYMTGHASVPIAVEAMKKGAVTYLEKPLDVGVLQKTLATVFSAEGIQWSGDADSSDVAHQEYKSRYAQLTPRELDVLNGIVEGKMNKVIAYELGISVKTIEIHRSQVKKKMQAKSAADLVKMVLTERVL